ncbi:R3H domain-containing protein 1-like isoform X6 [Brienomyrus brachyistius]|uniref:R3H domain-containing protein 1-like isoform X6 n=1 Tax=Brienomyrus brachyistius TaxID=42636 RepID=UPI0020B23411|nr:R3H domain-containing protein 1-like isoform X6 [Brienomyrus brachyistius]
MRMSGTVTGKDEAEAVRGPEAVIAEPATGQKELAEASRDASLHGGRAEWQDKIQIHFSQPVGKNEPPIRDEDEKGKDTEEREKASRRMLSRDSSQEYTDSTGIDLHEFLVNTLKNNPRDRMMLLKLEHDILDFISNESQRRKFPPMTSYHRMLLHRVAAYFGLEHNVDPSGKSVIINKTSSTRIPDQKFSEHIKDDKTDDFQKRYILKRDNASLDRDDSMMRMRLKDDRRSKSIEEREEEYQRARDRIFAQDGTEAFPLDRRIQENEITNGTQQRRQIFRWRPPGRLKDGRSASSRQSSSENEPRYSELRPWSSTDSDSSGRILKPAMTKAGSFSGISVLMRGDSSGSSRGAGRLSKTGSESSGSLGSSTGSLCRSQLPPAPILGRTAILPSAGAGGSVCCEEGRPGLAVAPASAGYYLLQPAGMPPGSVLVNPHTAGQPPLNPDRSTVMYSPTVLQPRARLHQPLPSPTLPASHPHQPTHHMLPQDSLGPQFSHLSLGRQLSSEGPDGHAAMYPAPLVLHAPQAGGYMGGAPPQPVVQQSLPPFPQGYMQQQQQQPPMQQVPACYCAPAQFSLPAQPYRTATPVHYSGSQSQSLIQPNQQSGCQTVMPNQPHGYQSVVAMQPPPGQNLAGCQPSNMGSQMQGVLLHYPSATSCQVPVPQQTMVLPVQSGQGIVPSPSVQVYYSVLPAAQQSTMSSSLGFPPPQQMEPTTFPRTPPACGGQQQHPEQQRAGGPAPHAANVVMLHLALPPSHQPQPHSPPHWKYSKHHSLDYQRGPKLTELAAVDALQSSPPLGSPASSPIQSPGPAHDSSIKSVRPGLAPIPIMPQFTQGFVPGQGDVRYPLLGQPLHYNAPVCPPLLTGPHVVLNHQGPTGVRQGGRGKKPPRRAVSTDLSVGEAVNGRILEVASRKEAMALLSSL